MGNRKAAAPAMSTVSRMMRVPDDSLDRTGRAEKSVLAAMDTATTPAITRFLRAGGRMTAKNMP